MVKRKPVEPEQEQKMERIAYLFCGLRNVFSDIFRLSSDFALLFHQALHLIGLIVKNVICLSDRYPLRSVITLRRLPHSINEESASTYILNRVGSLDSSQLQFHIPNLFLNCLDF
jgi:hypothetical protein